ncbi:MAG: transposase [Phycisphaerales bacterium]|nr:transposase [Phycisphaerales bacterium]
MNVITAVAPQAMIIHDKFHLIKKLTEVIDKIRRKEVVDNPLLLKQKYTVLKNENTRTEEQQNVFKQIDQANLKTAQAWHVRENFKTLFMVANKKKAISLFDDWVQESKARALMFLDKVIACFEKHKPGIINAFITHTTSAMHENINGRIQGCIG